MKEDLEKLGVKKIKTWVFIHRCQRDVPLDQMWYDQKAVSFFSKNLKRDQLKTIKECLKMIEFGMSTTFIQFQDQYWLYGGGMVMDMKGLTIGGFESAWLADLVTAYIFQKA